MGKHHAYLQSTHPRFGVRVLRIKRTLVVSSLCSVFSSKRQLDAPGLRSRHYLKK
jgi:hypothetical protein